MKTKITFALLILVALLSLPYVAKAQDDKLDEFTFEDEKVKETKQPYFALSAGVTGEFLFMDYDAINSKFMIPMQLEELSGPMFMIGANIFTALSPIVNNARIGFIYQSGSQSSENTVPTENISINNYAKLSVQKTGFHFDYAFVPTKSFAVIPGLAFKWGSMTFEQYQTSSNATSWTADDNDSTTIPIHPIQSAGQKIRYSFMEISPQVNIDYALTGFLMIRANVGYSLHFDNPFSKHAWTINGNNEYKNVPNVGLDGLTLQIGLFLGLFNY